MIIPHHVVLILSDLVKTLEAEKDMKDSEKDLMRKIKEAMKK